MQVSRDSEDVALTKMARRSKYRVMSRYIVQTENEAIAIDTGIAYASPDCENPMTTHRSVNKDCHCLTLITNITS